MEASANKLNLKLEDSVREVAIDSYTDHQTAIEEHLEHARHVSYERGRQQEAETSRQRLHEIERLQQQQIDSVLNALTNAVPEMLKEAEIAVKELALQIAQKFVASSPVTEERIHHLVTEALCGIEGSQKIEVTLHPQDLELLNESSAELSRRNQSAGDIRFLSSPNLTRGGCKVETDFGQLDATVESKTDQIKHLLSDPSIAA